MRTKVRAVQMRGVWRGVYLGLKCRGFDDLLMWNERVEKGARKAPRVPGWATGWVEVPFMWWGKWWGSCFEELIVQHAERTLIAWVPCLRYIQSLTEAERKEPMNLAGLRGKGITEGVSLGLAPERWGVFNRLKREDRSSRNRNSILKIYIIMPVLQSIWED